MADAATTTADVDAGTTAAPWGLMLAAGIGTGLLGGFMLVYPTAASIGVTLVLGWVMLVAGVLGIVGAIAQRGDGGMWTGLILGLLTAIAGLLLATNVLVGTLTLTMLFALWLVADGIVGTAASIARRGVGWGWWLASSLVSLMLGVMLLSAFPTSALWILGTYAGIVMLFRGMVLVVLSLEVRRISGAA